VFTAAGQSEALNRPLHPGYDAGAEVALEEPAVVSCGKGSVEAVMRLPTRQAFEVEADGQALLVTRDTHARGWRATVDDQPARVLRANGKHRAVPIPAGRHRVVLTYHPPGLGVGLALMALGAAATVGLWLRPVRPGPAANAGGGTPPPGGGDPRPAPPAPSPR
jgi:hypothetical protein